MSATPEKELSLLELGDLFVSIPLNGEGNGEAKLPDDEKDVLEQKHNQTNDEDKGGQQDKAEGVGKQICMKTTDDDQQKCEEDKDDDEQECVETTQRDIGTDQVEDEDVEEPKRMETTDDDQQNHEEEDKDDDEQESVETTDDDQQNCEEDKDDDEKMCEETTQAAAKE